MLSGTTHAGRSNDLPPDPLRYTYHVSLLPQAAHQTLPWFRILQQYYNNLKYHIPGLQMGIYKSVKAIRYRYPVPLNNPVWI